MDFRIDLEIYRGPLDLLEYLVRKDEIDVTDLPLASITDQFLGYLEVVQALDIGDASEFLEMAGYLIELKSKLVLPHGEDQEQEIDDPRLGLVERLLEYKKFKDAASLLDDRRQQWQKRYPRQANDLPPRKLDPSNQPIREVELWDLVSAFGRVMRDSRPTEASNIVYDETPITVYMQRIHQRLTEAGKASFSEMFQGGMHKSALIGVFLAILELVRHHKVVTRQNELHGEIWVYPGDTFHETIDLSQVDSYEHGEAGPAIQESADATVGPESREGDGRSD